ncbi:MAG: YdeI/OmpD-associated family protein [Propionibacteriaceae bacterium]
MRGSSPTTRYRKGSGWSRFPPSTRRAILEWIGSAKRPETHQKRIVETVQQAALNVRANQWPGA